IGLPTRTFSLDGALLSRIDVVGGDRKAATREVAEHRLAHSASAYEPDVSHLRIACVHDYLFCVIVSSNAGCPAFTFAIARFNAAATFFGSSIGPSPYQPIDRASLPKSGSGSLISMPMWARSTGVPRSFAMRIWCSQSL